jgi:hypothetical protein
MLQGMLLDGGRFFRALAVATRSTTVAGHGDERMEYVPVRYELSDSAQLKKGFDML